jgi:fumarate hydratase subunit alpha
MRTIPYTAIVSAVKDMCLEAAYNLPYDVAHGLRTAMEKEQSPLGRSIIESCIENAAIASRDRVPLCQDTGFAVYFVEAGSSVMVEGGILTDAINEGTRAGYAGGYLRASIVDDPLFLRKNTRDNTPAVIHLTLVPGDVLRITLAPKGGGSENMGAVAMLKPADGKQGVIDFVVKTVVAAGGNPCPPTMVGVGLGGTMEMAALLAKKALLRPIGGAHADSDYAQLEKEILFRINASGIGPQGLGGSITALSVAIETFPCHIASMPVAVNLNCHVARHSVRTL